MQAAFSQGARAGGGLILISCRSFIHTRASVLVRGAVLSAVIVIFGGMLFSGPLANTLNKHILPTRSYGLLGTASLACAVLMNYLLKKFVSRKNRPAIHFSAFLKYLRFVISDTNKKTRFKYNCLVHSIERRGDGSDI
ncbi:MAG: hypothetical protein M0018_06865 [Nitrospiraceae bacterium]|nr:hypothetical protein [Nitrospiraceae bacterium]